MKHILAVIVIGLGLQAYASAEGTIGSWSFTQASCLSGAIPAYKPNPNSQQVLKLTSSTMSIIQTTAGCVDRVGPIEVTFSENYIRPVPGKTAHDEYTCANDSSLDESQEFVPTAVFKYSIAVDGHHLTLTAPPFESDGFCSKGDSAVNEYLLDL